MFINIDLLSFVIYLIIFQYITFVLGLFALNFTISAEEQPDPVTSNDFSSGNILAAAFKNTSVTFG